MPYIRLTGIIAVVTDSKDSFPLPKLDINAPEEVANFYFGLFFKG